MTGSPARPAIGFVEFVLLLGFMSALMALATDAMLPALPAMGRELDVDSPNLLNQVIFVYFVGMGVSQLFYGPLSDSFGRRPLIFAGLGLFFLGGAICALAGSFWVLLLGRVIQGVGGAGPRVMAIAITRDRYEGREMARVASLVMIVFIFGPVIAPALGQATEQLAGWRAIFWGLSALAAVAAVWTALRLQETLPPPARRTPSLRRFSADARRALGDRRMFWYTVAGGFIFAPFLVYLGVAQHFLGEFYGLGEQFPIAFGGLALSFAAAAYLNSRLVRRFGMRALSFWALIFIVGVSIAFLPLALAYEGAPPLWTTLGYFGSIFFAVAMVFSNFNALAMTRMGEIAGVAASLNGAISIFAAVVLAQIIGWLYTGPVYAFILGFLACALATLACTAWAEAKEAQDARADLGDPSDA